MMGLKPGMRGLDAGCGTGGPSRNLVRFVDVHVTGVNITPVHLERARWWAGREGVGGRVEYVEGDFMVRLFLVSVLPACLWGWCLLRVG